MAPSALLVGAGGALGRPLVEEFIRQKARFSRIAILATDPSRKAKFSGAEEAGIEIVVGGLLESSSYSGFDFVISLVGNPLLKLQPAMIDIAYSAGVRHFYPSEFGIDLSQEWTFRHRYFRSKQDTRLHLIQKAKDNPDFKYTLFVCDVFVEWATYAFNEAEKTFQYNGSLEAAWHVTSLPDVCCYTVESILVPSLSQKREIKIAGEKTTVSAIAESIGRAKGIEVKLLSLGSGVTEQKQVESFKNGDEAGEYQWALLDFSTSGGSIVMEDVDHGLLQLKKPDTVDEALANYYGTN